MVRENRLFLGNPGTGKSTLINCLIGKPKLKSGLSWGGGLTQAYHRVEHNGDAYMDTPGLADSSIAKQAAKAITEALQHGGSYKLFFMMRLQNGRVVSEDVVTLERVLSAIDVDATKIRFSIVFNTVDKAQYALLSQPSSREFASVKRVVNGRRFNTNAFCFIPEIAALSEASDAVASLPQHVYDFVEAAQVMRIDPSVVKPVDPRGFEQQAREVRDEMERLLREKTVMLSALEERHQDAMQRERASHAGWDHNIPRGKYDALVHSPTHDYTDSPQTPRLEQPRDDKPSSSILVRKKTLIMVAVAILVVFAVSISLVATLTGSKSRATQTPSPTTETPTPTTHART